MVGIDEGQKNGLEASDLVPSGVLIFGLTRQPIVAGTGLVRVG